jgi:hypothetical protein
MTADFRSSAFGQARLSVGRQILVDSAERVKLGEDSVAAK